MSPTSSANRRRTGATTRSSAGALPSFAALLAERMKPTPVDVFGLIGYEPNCLPRSEARRAGVREADLPAPCGQCPQERFHAATEFDVLYGGAAGGGKTAALVAEALRAAVRYPGIRIGAFRRTNPELEESLLAQLTEWGHGKALGARWNGSKMNLTFPNGSLIMFRYAENLQDATRRQGGQYQMLIFDERTLTPPEVCSFLESRLRSGNSAIPVLGIRSGTNPGGVGHGEVKKRYITPTDYGEKVITDVRGRRVRFIPSKLTDNPHINPEYAHDLDALPEKLRAAFRDGSWDVFAGQMFAEWRHDRHTIAPFTLPTEWKRYQSVDWGYAAPWGVLWGAQDEDGRLYIYRELYATQVGEAEQARRILEAEAGEPISGRWADDAMWAERGDAKPIAAVYAEQGVPLTPAGKGPGSRVNGWQRVHSFLAEGPACPHHRALGWDTCPMLHAFTTCTELIRTLPNLPHSQTGNPEDADTKSEDHLPDTLRYMVINLGGGASFLIESDRDPSAPPQLVGMPDALPAPIPNTPFVVLPDADGNTPELLPRTGGRVVIVDE